MENVLAQSLKVGGTKPLVIEGPLVGINKLSDVINIVLSFLFPFVGIILLIEFVYAGYCFIRSDGEAGPVKEAKYRMTYAIIGLFILISAFLITRIASYILGFGGEIF